MDVYTTKYGHSITRCFDPPLGYPLCCGIPDHGMDRATLAQRGSHLLAAMYQRVEDDQTRSKPQQGF